ncbi:Hsp20/alpha crystallin family protein [Litchfieldia salsa]|uniref:HSP20 family protein n=1 Tax=Litchfieldia salsa TaxID=930152 RepID=A0A1H0Q7D3_9BACI|nr:Hsp20/alpha crystallin family protein [Litchfieldia salsa]SDP12588.1 HSP20 family protein [Litchfieldia salsa]
MYYDSDHQFGSQRTSTVKHRNHQQKAVRTPRIDFVETENQYYIRLSIPGVKKENLEININQEGNLEIKGKVITILPENTKNIIFQEIYQGPFHRLIKIPNSIDKQSVQFSYNSGILEVSINKG